MAKTSPPAESNRPLLVDLHTDALLQHVLGEKDITRRSDVLHVDLPRLREAGVNLQVFAIWVDPKASPAGRYHEQVARALDAFGEVAVAAQAVLGSVHSPDEVRGVVDSGRIGAILGVEGGHALDGELARLEGFFGLGVRILTLTWNNASDIADTCIEKNIASPGLTDFGLEVLRLSNRLGIMVDLSHASEAAFWDVLRQSRAPVLVSHAGARRLCDHPRNLNDEQLRALGTDRGLVGVVFLPAFVHAEPDHATLEHVLNHIEHIADKAGVDSVALGSDFDGFDVPGPKGLEDVTKLPAIGEGLKARGFRPSEVERVLGGNFLRFWREVAALASG